MPGKGSGNRALTSALTVALLRELFRQHQAWHSSFEAHEVSDVLTHDGYEISLWDLDYLVEATELLPPRQRQAIHLCLLANLREEDAAVQMGVSRTNPVSMYANEGLKKIIVMIETGALPRFKPDGGRDG